MIELTCQKMLWSWPR